MRNTQGIATAGLVILCALLGAGCGGPKSSDTTAPGAVTTQAPQQLDSAVLAPEDVGTGWIRQMGEKFATRGMIPVVEDQAWCPEAAADIAQLKKLAGDSGVIVALKEPVGRGASHTVTEQVWSASGAEGFVTAFVDAVARCDGRTWKSSDGNKMEFASLDAPPVGDASGSGISTVTTKAPTDQAQWRSRMAAVRSGNVVVQVRETDVQTSGSQPFLTDAEWRDLVATAVQKVIDSAG